MQLLCICWHCMTQFLPSAEVTGGGSGIGWTCWKDVHPISKNVRIRYFNFNSLQRGFIILTFVLFFQKQNPTSQFEKWGFSLEHMHSTKDYFLDCFSYFRQISLIASSNNLPKDLSVSTARCFSSLMRSESTLVENIFFSPMQLDYSFSQRITRNNIDI